MTNQGSDEGRELTVDELDIEDMVGNMHFRIGGAWALLGGTQAGTPDGATARARIGRAIELRGDLWALIPFAKALGRLARENPGRTRELWAEALREPMPFGGEAIGMPRVANLAADGLQWLRPEGGSAEDAVDRAAGKGD